MLHAEGPLLTVDVGGRAVEAKKYEQGACSACAYACELPTRD